MNTPISNRTMCLLVLTLSGCTLNPPLPHIRLQDQIIIERNDTKVCEVGGKVWSQSVAKECGL